LVSTNYFSVLGVQPMLGRGFLSEDDRTPGASPFVVISYRFWRHGLAGDPQAPGKTISLNGTAFSIVGIAPQEFTGTSEVPVVPDFWAPLSMQSALVPGQDWLNHPDERHLELLARVKPGDLEKAQSQANVLARQMAGTSTDADATTAITLQEASHLPNTDRAGFQALAAAVMLIFGLVLFVACANVGNMLLARGSARQREISTRLALGASRQRVIRQLLVEGVLLSCLGGCVALALSMVSTSLLTRLVSGSSDLNLALNLAPDIRVVAFVLGLSLVTGILFGLSPALQFTRRDITTAMRDAGTSLGHVGGSRLRSSRTARIATAGGRYIIIAGRVTADTPCARRSDRGLAPGASGIGASKTKNSTNSRNWGSEGTSPPRS
jgi:hypothetical protein